MAAIHPTLPTGWHMTETDRAMAEELRARLPAKIWGFHEHLYRKRDFKTVSGFLEPGPDTAGAAEWTRAMESVLGEGRMAGALFTPFPSAGTDVSAINTFVLQEAERSGNLATIVIGPDSNPEQVAALLANPRVKGFKPYHIYSEHQPTFQSAIGDFIPEWAWKMADEQGLLILLHMVRDRALADPGNQADIRRLCEKYPRAQLVLAHAARGFHAPNTVKGLACLAELQNVWFDMAAVCEATAITAILEAFGPRRLMWGSDFPVSQQRGRCVTVGNGFAWITTDQVQWNDTAFFGQPVPVILESVRALFEAADAVGLDANDLTDIFHDNAVRLLGLATVRENQTQALYRQARRVIPGGTQLLSKRPEMFAPDQWPAYFREAKGCEVWDLDGRHYYDFSTHGIGACLLGFRDPDVTRAVRRRLNLGSFSTLNSPDEVRLQDVLCDLHPWAEQVRYARSGGESMAVAVRIARATTDRSVVAICGYHGWQDWYLAANLGEGDSLRGHLLPGLNPLGVPRELRGTAFTFAYNDREALRRIVDEHGSRLAAVVMEPCRYHDPSPGFLEFVRNEAHRVGALWIIDEITIGWRLVCGGAHLRFNVAPDMAVFAKTMGNGHPMAAIIGTKNAMEGANTSFISSTYWTESIGPAAAIATLEKMKRIDVPAHCERIGRRVQAGWRDRAVAHRLPVKVDDGYGALAHFAFEHPLANELKTLYVQEMLDRGFLAGLSLYVTLAHTDSLADRYLDTVDAVFGVLEEALTTESVTSRLKGPVAHTGFRRLI
jgi:glutamate-1-semialdehyde 2,1-aminomutase